MVRSPDRRSLLQMVGGAALLAAGGVRSVFARDAGTIARLIDQAGTLDPISARIEFISRSFLGTRYVGNTLIGSPRRPEQFVATTPSIA